VETRRIYHSPATRYPGDTWVEKQTLDFVTQRRSDGLRIKQVNNDRDTKFRKGFRQAPRSRRIKPLRTTYRAPT
jgi:hypothetical protein